MTKQSKGRFNNCYYIVGNLLIGLLCVWFSSYYGYVLIFISGLCLVCLLGYLLVRVERYKSILRRAKTSHPKHFLINGFYRGKKIERVADLKKGKYYIVDRFNYELLLYVEEGTKDWYGKFVACPQNIPYWVGGYFMDSLVLDTKINQVYGAVKNVKNRSI